MLELSAHHVLVHMRCWFVQDKRVGGWYIRLFFSRLDGCARAFERERDDSEEKVLLARNRPWQQRWASEAKTIPLFGKWVPEEKEEYQALLLPCCVCKASQYADEQLRWAQFRTWERYKDL